MLSSNRTYKVILLIGIISILLFLVERIYINTMKSLKTGSIGKINAVINHDLDVNLSIWGASTALVNFNPLIIRDSLNISAFNMGLNGVNIDQYNGLLKEYLNYTKESNFIIIAIDIYGGLEKREQFYELHNWIQHLDNENIYDCLYDIDCKTMVKAKYIPFYPITLYSKHTFPLFRSALLNNSSSEYQFINLGFEPNNALINSKEIDTTQIIIPINNDVFKKLRNSCFLALSKKIRPIIVITPCRKDGLNKIKNVEKFVTLLQTLEKEGIVVYNYLNSPISSNPSFFEDNTHLNTKGADIFTEDVINNLKSDFNFNSDNFN